MEPTGSYASGARKGTAAPVPTTQAQCHDRFGRRAHAHLGGRVSTNTAHVWVNGRSVPVPDGAASAHAEPRVVARLTGPVTAQWRRRLERAGTRVEFWCPPYGVCLSVLDAAAPARLAELPFVAGFVPYGQRHCDRGLGRPRRGPGRHWLDVVCFAATDKQRVVGELSRIGATVLDTGHTKVRVDWPGAPIPIRDIVGVKLVERPRLPRPAGGIGLAADIGDAAPTPRGPPRSTAPARSSRSPTPASTPASRRRSPPTSRGGCKRSSRGRSTRPGHRS